MKPEAVGSWVAARVALAMRSAGVRLSGVSPVGIGTSWPGSGSGWGMVTICTGLGGSGKTFAGFRLSES